LNRLALDGIISLSQKNMIAPDFWHDLQVIRLGFVRTGVYPD
jgi:hypothetical protein